MKTSEIARLRLTNQGIGLNRFKSPADAVRWFGAVQAQDYLGSLWALGLRLRGADEVLVERAVTERSIVRTWPMRGTLHFVAAEDVRWMLGLLGARTVARAAGRYRQLGLDEATFAKSRRVLERALRGRQLTRPELAAALERQGIATDGQRLIHLLNRSALEGLTCYASRRGKQFTFALLDEWAPSNRSLTREEALAELAARYFRSHGPATLQDFVWWSSLRTTDARAGLEMTRPRLVSEMSDGQTYWLSLSTPAVGEGKPPAAHLLPAFDEYTVAYKERGAVLHPSHTRLSNAAFAVLGPTVILDGRAVGTWKRTLKKESALIETSLWKTLKRDERSALDAAAQRYGAFVGLPAVVA